MTMMTAPIPYEGRLSRAIRRQHEDAQTARVLQQIARETDVAIGRPASSRFEFPDPADLRGIPVVGRNIAGVIRGSRPEDLTMSDREHLAAFGWAWDEPEVAA